MKEFDDIRIIDRDEGIILYDALHEYFMKRLKEHKKPTEEDVKINTLYQSLKTWMNNS